MEKMKKATAPVSSVGADGKQPLTNYNKESMDKLNNEYMAILSGEGNASEKFWKLEKRIKEDKKDCGVQCEMSSSNQFYIMLELLNEGAITIDDLEDFSIDLQETMKHFFNR